LVGDEHVAVHNWNEQEGQLVPQDQWCISKSFSLQYTGISLPTFQDTQAKPG